MNKLNGGFFKVIIWLLLTLNIRNTSTQSIYCKVCLSSIISSRKFFSIDEICGLLNIKLSV